MKKDLENKLIALINKPGYQPARFNIIAKKLGLKSAEFAPFKLVIKELVRQGRIEVSKKNEIRPIEPHGTITGIFRKAGGGFGFVRPHGAGEPGMPPAAEIFIPERFVNNAISGDEVLVRVLKKPQHGKLGPSGEIVRVLTRATNQFVGTYFERDGQGLVRVDGTVFAHSVFVGDPGAKGAKPNDKVVFEMLRFPSPDDRGEGVITEILGPRGQPGVDTLSVIRSLGLPDVFRRGCPGGGPGGREPVPAKKTWTAARISPTWLTITIDPADARDFDDAVSLSLDPRSKHWMLGVHIADVGHFAPPGSALDREARRRSHQRLSAAEGHPDVSGDHLQQPGLAAAGQGPLLQERLMDLTPAGQKAHVRFANSAIKVSQRFAYEQVLAILQNHDARLRPSAEDDRLTPNRQRRRQSVPQILDMLLKMRELALILHKRRVKRGALELSMPEIDLTYDEQGRVSGGHFHKSRHQPSDDRGVHAAGQRGGGGASRSGRRAVPAPRPSRPGADQAQGVSPSSPAFSATR